LIDLYSGKASQDLERMHPKFDDVPDALSIEMGLLEQPDTTGRPSIK
jgi:hypothetical protein